MHENGAFMNKTTQELLDILKSSSDINHYIDQEQSNLVQIPLCEYLSQMLMEKNISASTLIQKSGLQKQYAYQILRGERQPSRDKVLAICFALRLSLDETQMLLKQTGYPPLYARIEKDSILIFGLQRRISVTDVKELLHDFGHEILA